PPAAPSSRPPLTPAATPPRELTFHECGALLKLLGRASHSWNCSSDRYPIGLWCEGAEVSMVPSVTHRVVDGTRQPTCIARAKRRQLARAERRRHGRAKTHGTRCGRKGAGTGGRRRMAQGAGGKAGVEGAPPSGAGKGREPEAARAGTGGGWGGAERERGGVVGRNLLWRGGRVGDVCVVSL